MLFTRAAAGGVIGRLVGGLVAGGLACSAAAQCDPLGSPVVDRAIEDASSGVVLVHRGAGAPPAGPATVASWSFFDNSSAGAYVTPLVFRVQGEQFVLVGVGTPRASTAAGAQTHPFGLIAGTATAGPGEAFTVGFTTRRIEPGAGDELETVASYAGVVDFTGYNDFSDPWDYALASGVSLGQVYGPGGVVLNSGGFAGRIYSAQFTLAGCACPADCDGSGSLNVDDVQCFVEGFIDQSSGGDCDGNGAWNVDDVQCFVASFLGGC